MNPLLIDLRHFPAEGVHREGSLPSGFFALAAADPVRPQSPVAYSLDITRDDDEIIVEGEVSACFSLECGRCAGRFDYRLEMPDLLLEVPVASPDHPTNFHPALGVAVSSTDAPFA